jgi:spore coat polysaccharide biosynthesis protein SpsF
MKIDGKNREMTRYPRTVATIEARMGSSRLPGKVLMESVGKPMLELMVERLKRVPSLDGIVIATTTNPGDGPIEELAGRLGIGCHRGSEDDVLARLLGAAEEHDIGVVVQTTGDCPLIDPVVVEECIQIYRRSNVDYVSNILERSYPIGMDTQVFAASVLADVARRTDDPIDREHGSVFIYHHPEIYSLKNVSAPEALTDPKLRLTLDTAQDYKLINRVFEDLYPANSAFTLGNVLTLLRNNPDYRAFNAGVQHRYV